MDAAAKRLDAIRAHCTAPEVTPVPAVDAVPTACWREEDLGVLEESYDYVVVGAGSAGCALAYRLAESGATVLLLESGDDDISKLYDSAGGGFLTIGTDLDWQFRTTPQPHVDNRIIPLPRGKVLGGCSSMNMAIYVRGNPDNFDGWERAGCTGWSYKDVLPYFKRLEHTVMLSSPVDTATRGTGGPVTVTEVFEVCNPTTRRFLASAEELGLPILKDYNDGHQFGVALSQTSARGGVRASTSKAYLAPPDRGCLGLSSNRFRKEKTLTIACLSHVTTLIMDGDRCVGVNIKRGSIKLSDLRRVSEQAIYAKKEVILSAGAYGSPWILMLSGIGPAAHLREHGIPVRRDLPVGQSLSDHPYVPFTFSATSTDPVTSNSVVGMVKNALRFMVFRGGPMASTPLQGTAFLNSTCAPHDADYAAAAPDLQIHYAPGLPMPLFSDKAMVEPEMFKKMPTYGITFLPCLLRPLARGHLSLVSNDPHVMPTIDHKFLESPRDLAVLVDGIKFCRRVTKARAFAVDGLKEIVDETIPYPPESDDYIIAYIRKYVLSTYHPVGTCRMGDPGASTTVVDPRLRVVGIKGLRVVDASVMPFVPSGNTNAASIMIGEKGADLILEDNAK